MQQNLNSFERNVESLPAPQPFYQGGAAQLFQLLSNIFSSLKI
jgi:hypothetical protein